MNRLIDWLGANMPARRRPRLAGARRLPHRQYDLRRRRAETSRRARLGAFDARPSVRRPRLSVHAVAASQRRRFPRPRRARPRGARHPERSRICRALLRADGAHGGSALEFPLAFSFFRIAAICQGVYKRALDGNASNPERGRKMGAAVPVMARRRWKWRKGNRMNVKRRRSAGATLAEVADLGCRGLLDKIGMRDRGYSVAHTVRRAA